MDKAGREARIGHGDNGRLRPAPGQPQFLRVARRRKSA